MCKITYHIHGINIWNLFKNQKTVINYSHYVVPSTSLIYSSCFCSECASFDQHHSNPWAPSASSLTPIYFLILRVRVLEFEYMWNHFPDLFHLTRCPQSSFYLCKWQDSIVFTAVRYFSVDIISATVFFIHSCSVYLADHAQCCIWSHKYRHLSNMLIACLYLLSSDIAGLNKSSLSFYFLSSICTVPFFPNNFN